MEFRLEYMAVYQDGVVFTDSILDKSYMVINEVQLSEQLGDDLHIKHGDLHITTNSPDLLSGSLMVGGRRFFALYIDDLLFNVYYSKTGTYETYDEKKGLYTWLLSSVTALFYKDASEQNLAYTSDPNRWSFGLEKQYYIVERIQLLDGDGNNQQRSAAYAYYLAGIISNIAGKNNYSNYVIGTVSHQIPGAGEDAPFLFKGTSEPDGTSEETALNNNLGSLTWQDVYQMAMYAQDAYLFIQARIDSSGSDTVLYFDINLIPKSNNTTSGALSDSIISWKERTHKSNYNKVDKVEITGNNFTYSNGSGTERVMERTLDLSDPDVNQADYATEMYLVWFLWTSGLNKYNQDVNYISSAHIDVYYSPLVSGKNGWKGEILYTYNNGSSIVHLSDKLSFGANTIQLIKITSNEKGTAKIEGIEI